MDIRILKEALKHYVQSADCPTENRDKVLEAIGECQATIDRLISNEDPDDFGFTVRTIPFLVLSDFLNILTYDIYGKRAKAHGTKFPFSYYAHDVYKAFFNTDLLTAEQLLDGYEVIADLWQDNEANGEHNSDGTFNKSTGHDKAIDKDLLQRVIKRLQDKVTIDQEYMEKDDLRQLLNDIDELKQAAQKLYMDKVCGITTITLD